MEDKPRLIERAFPLKQASLTSVHEKCVRHGHISTMHIWPARRPLAACRAALIATLLPAPNSPEEQRKLCRKIGGTIEEKSTKKKLPDGSTVERIGEEVRGGVLGWLGGAPLSGGRKKAEDFRTRAEFRERELAHFRKEIRKAYGGRAPRVLDPFAGGGAIPLEAMRLGCEVTASDLNPVAWLVLKGTLDYPQQLAGKTHPLPEFILKNEEFMMSFFIQTKGCTKVDARNAFTDLVRQVDKQKYPKINFSSTEIDIKADLSWQVRAWARWVLFQARKELSEFYPTYADYEPTSQNNAKLYEKKSMQLVPVDKDGTPDINALNSEFSKEYLDDESKPRWVVKPTIAYLWARTVECKNCRAILPLLKTQWLCKNDRKRILLAMKAKIDKTGVEFSVENNVPIPNGSAGDKNAQDKRIGAGTMSKSGARCPCCDTTMTMDDIRREAQAGRLGNTPTAVITESQTTKSYRLPTAYEIECAEKSELSLEDVFSDIPFQVPSEPTPAGGASGVRVQNYGLMRWSDLFTARQLLAHGTVLRQIRRCTADSNELLPSSFRNAVTAYLAILFDKTVDYNSSVCVWHNSGELICHTFSRFAIPITWDFVELAGMNDVGGGYLAQLDWLTRYLDVVLEELRGAEPVEVVQRSATQCTENNYDVIITDPPYYDAISYSDCMDFFYVWIKRIIHKTSLDNEVLFSNPTAPKWSHQKNDGELVDDPGRHGGDATLSKKTYEDGMARAFSACEKSLREHGRMVIVFAHKHPDAWETLVSAIIKAGFIVDGSWPIQTEMATRMRAKTSAALSSSVWLVCRKRPKDSSSGWDTMVLKEMQTNITRCLREYWDADIRGPDFVWAATGPAMEAYSRYPVVKKADTPGELMTISEFLTSVRRMVVDFVVGRVLTGDDGDSDATAIRMDKPTSYYLLHRNDFAFNAAPAGACILYATACGLSDQQLEIAWGLISRVGSADSARDEDDVSTVDDAKVQEVRGTGNSFKLKTWKQRNNPKMGYEAPGGNQIPLIDRVHRLMHLWAEGSQSKVDGYLDDNGLRRHELFNRFMQSLIELSEKGGAERATLEGLSNYVKDKDARASTVGSGNLDLLN